MGAYVALIPVIDFPDVLAARSIDTNAPHTIRGFELSADYKLERPGNQKMKSQISSSAIFVAHRHFFHSDIMFSRW